MISDRRFPRHAHDEYGLGLLDSGAHRTCSAIGQVEASAGDVITINPGEMHDGAPVDGGTRTWRMLYFDPTLVASELLEDARRPMEILRPVVRDFALHTVLNQLFALVVRNAQSDLLVEETLFRVLMRVFCEHGTQSVEHLATTPVIARARQRLDDAPEIPVTLADLAEEAGISRFQLLRGFSREVGVTPHAYLLQRRVRLARRLMTSGRSLAEAAAESGFSDQSHMTRAFSRQLGVTPARYRDAVGHG